MRGVELRLARRGPQRAHLDLIWRGRALNTETAMGWETDPMRIGTESLPLTVRDVVERHGGEFWFERERARHRAFFRFRLPLAAAQDEPSCGRRRAATAAPSSTTSTCSRPRRKRASSTSARWPRSPTRCSTPRPPGWTRRRATRSSRSARPASSTASCCATRASSNWSIRSGRFPAVDRDPRHPARDAGRPADHRRGAAGVPRLRAGHGAGRAQRGLRHALPADEGERRPASASISRCSTRCCCRRCCIPTRNRTPSKRSPSAWG